MLMLIFSLQLALLATRARAQIAPVTGVTFPVSAPASSPVQFDSDPETGGGTIGNSGFICVEDEATGEYGCVYAGSDQSFPSFPFDTPESFLFAVCVEDLSFGREPTR